MIFSMNVQKERKDLPKSFKRPMGHIAQLGNNTSI